jgi:hypothetical protein
MKARELEEGMTVRSGRRIGKVTRISVRVSFLVQPEKGPSVGWYVDGDEEIEVLETQGVRPEPHRPNPVQEST